MARGRFLTRTIASGILGAVVAVLASSPGFAGDAPKLAFTGSATLTTDYMFRSISNTNQNPASQVEFDAGYGIFWAYIWGSNTSFGENIEIDYGGGISPKWKDITFTIGGLEYTYPGANDIDYFELKTGGVWATGPWSLGLNNYWSPNNFGLDTQSDALEGSVGYTFSGKLWNFFTPSISATLGNQWYEKTDVVPNFLYWNAGLTLGFLEHWSADIRYYDTDYNQTNASSTAAAGTTATRGRWVPSRPPSSHSVASPEHLPSQGAPFAAPFFIRAGAVISSWYDRGACRKPRRGARRGRDRESARDLHACDARLLRSPRARPVQSLCLALSHRAAARPLPEQSRVPSP